MSEEVTLKEIIYKFQEYKNEIFKNKIRIILITILFCVSGFLIGFFSEKSYKADITFVVQSNEGSIGSGIAGAASMFGFNIGGSTGTYNQANIIELFSSRNIIKSSLLSNATIENKDALLIDHYIDINEFRESDSWIDEGISAISFSEKNTLTHDSIITSFWKAIIENNFSIKLNSSDASIITLSITSTNQYFSKSLVESMVDKMSKSYINYHTRNSRSKLDFLQERSDSVYKELKYAEEEYAKIKDINQKIVKASGRLKEIRLMRQVEVLNTMYLEIVKNLEVSKITLLEKTPIIEIMDYPVLPIKKSNTSNIVFAIIGMFLGIFLSTFYVIINKLTRDTIES